MEKPQSLVPSKVIKALLKQKFLLIGIRGPVLLLNFTSFFKKLLSIILN